MTTKRNVITAIALSSLTGVAVAGVAKLAAPPTVQQSIELRDVRFSANGVQLMLAVTQGSLSGGFVVRCLPIGDPLVAGKPAPAAAALCKAALAIPVLVTPSLAALIPANPGK